MHIPEKLKHEIKALSLAMLYFWVWFVFLILIKSLILAEYNLHAVHLSAALIAALILGKVVLILEHVPMPGKLSRAPVWVDMLLRTALYTAGVFLIMLLEKAVENLKEHDSFPEAFSAIFSSVAINHVMANTLCVIGALLTYNSIMVVREQLGPGRLFRIFSEPRS